MPTRRRRKKNTLLTRIIVVSLVVHAFALPVAAHFGAFDKLKRDFGSSRVVMVTVPPLKEKARAEKKKENKPKKATPTTKKSAAPAHRSTSRASSKPNPFQPKVIAATGPGSGEGTGPAVNPNGTGKAGLLPSGPPPSRGNTAPPVTTAPPPAPRETVTPKPPLPAPVSNEPVALAAPKAEPVVRKFVQVETTYAPDPVIPDDLRAEPLEKTAVVEADVNTDGRPENVKISASSGTRELDDIALDTARKYRFKPATYGNDPVVGHVRFTIDFKVE